METKPEILESQGTVMSLKLGRIKPSSINCYETDHIDELEKSIAFYGLLTPLTVARNNGKYEILSGHRRYKALVQMYGHQGLTEEETDEREVPCLVVAGDDLDPIIKELMIELANLEQRVIPDVFDHRMNVVRLYHKLCEKNIITDDEVKRHIRENLKLSDRYARMYDSIFCGGTEELKQAVASTSKKAGGESHAHIPLSTAARIAGLPEEEQKEIVERSDAGESVSDIMKSRKRATLQDFTKPDSCLSAEETEYGEDVPLVAPSRDSWEDDGADYGSKTLEECMTYIKDNAPEISNSIDTAGRIGSLEAEKSSSPPRSEARAPREVLQWLGYIETVDDPACLTAYDRECIEMILNMVDHIERLYAG